MVSECPGEGSADLDLLNDALFPLWTSLERTGPSEERTAKGGLVRELEDDSSEDRID